MPPWFPSTKSLQYRGRCVNWEIFQTSLLLLWFYLMLSHLKILHIKQGSCVGKHAFSFIEDRFPIHTRLWARQSWTFELPFSSIASKGKEHHISREVPFVHWVFSHLKSHYHVIVYRGMANISTNESLKYHTHTKYQNSIQSIKRNSALNVASLLTVVLLTYSSNTQKAAAMPFCLTFNKSPLTVSMW